MRLFKIFTNELRRLRKDSFLFVALLVMPLVLIFFLAQRVFMQGIVITGVEK